MLITRLFQLRDKYFTLLWVYYNQVKEALVFLGFYCPLYEMYRTHLATLLAKSDDMGLVERKNRLSQLSGLLTPEDHRVLLEGYTPGTSVSPALGTA